jgi:repressor of nif and glnA expression
MILGKRLPTLMQTDVDRKLIEILKILSEYSEPVGARVIARKLAERGYNLDERTVRYYLRILDERGLTRNLGYAGRVITEKGLEEIRHAFVKDRIGFVLAKIESLIFRMNFDLERRKGKVVVNTAIIDENYFSKALNIIRKVILAGYSVGPYVKVAKGGEFIGNYMIPEGKVLIATICSITLDGILHHAGIPVSPMFGGVVQFLDGKPVRFTDLVSYAGSTLDPLELFSAKGLSSVTEVVKSGRGYILANIREIPMDALQAAKKILQKAEESGISGVLAIGQPNMPILGVPVSMNRAGIAFIGGMNPLVAVNEARIPIEAKAIECLIEFEEMKHVNEIG